MFNCEERSDENKKEAFVIEVSLKSSHNIYIENAALKKQVEKEKGCPGKICESCEENPSKLYETPEAKWFCKDCDQHICNLCKMHMKNWKL